MSEQVNIREAKAEDMAIVAEQIRNLAKFEKMENMVQITEEMLLKDGGFKSANDRKYFHCYVAEVNRDKTTKLAGYTIFYYTYSTWLGKDVYVEDIYVGDDFRRMGIAQKLFKKVAKTSLEKGCKRLKLNVLDWNVNAIKLYDRLGGQNLTLKEGWNVYYFDEKCIQKMAKF